jgi:hypothetical protein
LGESRGHAKQHGKAQDEGVVFPVHGSSSLWVDPEGSGIWCCSLGPVLILGARQAGLPRNLLARVIMTVQGHFSFPRCSKSRSTCKAPWWFRFPHGTKKNFRARKIRGLQTEIDHASGDALELSVVSYQENLL